MNHPLAAGLFEAAFGLLLAFHCPRAAVCACRSGVAISRYGEVRRGRSPFQFRAIVGITLLAGVMGAGLVLTGIGTLGSRR